MISIRHAEAGDAQQIGAVFDAAVREGWGYMGELARNPMFPPQEWDELIVEHRPPNVLLVAIDASGEVAGFIAVQPNKGEMYLLFVHPRHGRRGVGRALLDAGHEALRAAGCREVFLYTQAKRTRDRRLRGRRLSPRRHRARVGLSRGTSARAEAGEGVVIFALPRKSCTADLKR
jgi:GNAT superfamily N-acetyltransferase